jgi:hypothetical protein
MKYRWTDVRRDYVGGQSSLVTAEWLAVCCPARHERNLPRKRCTRCELHDTVFCIKIVQDVPGVKVIILGGHNSGHSKQKIVYIHVSCSERFPRQLFHCTDEQHAMSSHELQSAWMLTVEFSKRYYTVFMELLYMR